MIKFSCKTCGKRFSLPDEYAGRRATCKACGGPIVVPAALEPPPSTEAAAVARTSGAEAAGALSPHAPKADPSRFSTNVRDDGAPGGGGGARDVATRSMKNAPAEKMKPPPTPAPRLSVRTRRLTADAEQMRRRFETSQAFKVLSMAGDPPEVYQVEFRLKSLEKLADGDPVFRDAHVAEIQLTSDYPRLPPKCRMLTPVFHPNVDESTICIGDHWAAGERLSDLVVRIGEMLAYQAYNIKSPLNGEAAMWADLHPENLPTDPRNLHAEAGE